MVTTDRIRHYQAEDYPVIRPWWDARGQMPLPQEMIPESSCVACDEDGNPAGFASVFCCNANHVAFLHGLVLHPGLTIRKARNILRHIEEGIAAIMHAGGHTHLVGTVSTRPGMLRGARMLGFELCGPTVQPVEKLVKPLAT